MPAPPELGIDENAGSQSTDDAADAVDAEDVEAVVVAERALDRRAEEEADRADDEAKDDRAHDTEKPQAGVIATRPATTPDTRPSAEGLPFAIHSTMHPRQASGAGRDERVDHRPGRRTALASRFEPTLKPNQPTHRSAAPIMHHHQRVRRHGFFAVADALAEDQAADEAGDTGVDVNDGAAGEVECAPLEDRCRRPRSRRP